MTYNGWNNYETWAANLWLSNDQGMVWAVDDQIEFIKNGCTTAPGDEVRELEFWLDEKINDLLTINDENISGLARDLLVSAAGEIDCNELARAYLDDYVDE